MAISQKLQARQSQSLTMTPKLQQAIKLLQMPNAELADFVDAEIEKNPLLTSVAVDPIDGTAETDKHSGEGEAVAEVFRAPVHDHSSDYHGSTGGSGARGGYNESSDINLESTLAAEVSMRQHLLTQIDMVGFGPRERSIAIRLVDETCENGFMRADTGVLLESLGVGIEEVEKVLAICQQFEPTGIMSRDLGECLKAQLIERNRFDPAMEAMIDNLDLLAANDFDALVELCAVGMDDVTDMMEEIKALDPRPGDRFADAWSPAAIIVPDILVRRAADGSHAVELNPMTLPRVLMDRSYYTTVSTKLRSDEDKDFLGQCFADGNWLVRSLDQRARTILAVSSEILRAQDGFFLHGPKAIVPLTLKGVANAIGMHESTVSRVTSNKYMATERGVFELKYFFSPAIASLSGGPGHSAEAVRHRIASLIAGEKEPGQPILSDDQLVERLRAAGIDIARRTVAKYRESLKILSSIERRRAARARSIRPD